MHPLTLVEPLTRRVQAGPPVSRIVAGPEPSILTELLTLAAMVAVPSAPIVASLAASFATSRLEMPRTTAVSLSACPLSEAFAGCTVHYFYELHPGAEHGYALPDRDIHDKRAANRDWELIFAMFRRQLSA